jgi:hypothetical protein
MHIYICRHANSFSSASFFSSIIIFPHSEEEIKKIERGVVSHQYKIYYRAEMKCEGRRRMKERKKEEEERPQNQN